MLSRILELEDLAQTLEPSPQLREEVIEQTTTYLESFMEKLPELKAYVKGEGTEVLALPIGETGKPLPQLLNILAKEVDHIGINPASGKHLGYLPGGGLWTSAMADMLAAGTNRFAGIFFASPGAVMIENQLIRWLCSLVGLPPGAHGNITSGGSIANLTAITAARDHCSINATNVRQAVIYCTDQVHHCVQKAFRITGLHEAIQRSVPMNDRLQMDTSALEQMIKEDIAKGFRPFLIVASAGTTNTGAVDPLDAIADLCEEHQIWFHVDAAYGGFFLLVDSMRPKFAGIERADSVVMDPHKGLFLPYGIGVVLVRDANWLLESFAHQASYMVDAYGFSELSPSDCGPELSKHFRGLRMWLPLHLHGVAPFRASLEEKVYLCQYFHEEVAKLGYETGLYPELSVALFRYPASDINEFNQKLVANLQADGRYFFSSTMIDGEIWIRCAVFSFRTHLAEIQGALQMLKEHADQDNSE